MADVPLDVVYDPAARRAFATHARVWQANRYVYPVVSRRSKGISIGVNLNPDKVCNFDCIYCCVNRKEPGPYKEVNLQVLRTELQGMLGLVTSGEIFGFEPFAGIPAGLRRVNDVAFSGDGEPTSCPNFLAACRLAAECVENSVFAMHNPQVAIKLVLITNATLFHRAPVSAALAFLDQHNGEIWAKLDAGTDAYYQVVDRSPVPFERVLENVKWCCLTRPTVIQSLFMRVHGQQPGAEEVEAYVGRLAEIVRAGGRIKLVQIYTVARGTAEDYATALSQAELERIAGRVRAAVNDVGVEVYC